MQFFDMNTNYRQAKILKRKYAGSGIVEKNPLKWYSRMISLFMDDPNCIPQGFQGGALLALEGEQQWITNGEPYFKVFPAMAQMMSEVSIDIPVTSFHVPYPSFIILLANSDQNNFIEREGLRLKWIMVYVRTLEFVGESRNVDVDYKFRPLESQTIPTFEKGGPALFINYEFTGEYRGEPNQYNYTLRLDRDAGTFEDFFEGSYDKTIDSVKRVTKKDEYLPSKEMVKRIVSLAVATAFFGVDNHEVVLPDIPRKKLEKRLARSETVAEMKQQLKEDKADTKRWTIGREISLPRPIGVPSESRGEPGATRELTHSFIRKGHMRYQVCGKDRKDRKLIFIHQCMIRPDLPLAKSHGYQIKDTLIAK